MKECKLPLGLWTILIIALNTLPSNVQAISRSNSTISLAWYTGWHASSFPLTQVSWEKYTHLHWAFAVTTPDVKTLSLDISDEQLLPKFVSMAQKNGVKAGISIGGWTGSRWFSPHVQTAENRTAFVKTVTTLAQTYKLDALDFDWEFPGLQGIGCNEVHPNDTVNFLSFLQELRNSTIGKTLTLSAATLDTPWVDSNRSFSTNLTAFSEVLDYISIMNYDVHSNPSIGAGSSSPLDDSCAPPEARFGSAMTAVKLWTAAGIPPKKIVLGVPAYGHSFVLQASTANTSTANGLIPNDTLPEYPQYLPGLERRGDMWDGDGGLDVCGNMTGPGGTFNYWGLVQEGFLNENGTAAKGVQYRFDNCSQTPTLYNTTTGIYVSYDDVNSYALKGGFIHTAGLKGFAMWEAGGDLNDTLLNSILNATQNGGPRPSLPKTQTPASHPVSSTSSLRLEAETMWGALALTLFFLGTSSCYVS